VDAAAGVVIDGQPARRPRLRIALSPRFAAAVVRTYAGRFVDRALSGATRSLSPRRGPRATRRP
jgi:hypothetical protein